MTYRKTNQNNQTILGGFLSLIFSAVGLMFKFIFSKEKQKGGTRSTLDRNMFREKWAGLEHLVKLGGESNHKSAIMEADKLLDLALKNLGVRGETMGERLKASQRLLSYESYQAAWEGHKVRNRMAHEYGYDLLHARAVETMENFKKALEDLKAL